VKILVVEDSPTMRQLISFALKRLRGAEIVEAGDGVEGLKKLNSDTFDLIITDINMPVMDGLKLISLVRRDVKYRNIPIMVITTEGGAEDRERASVPMLILPNQFRLGMSWRLPRAFWEYLKALKWSFFPGLGA